MLAWIAKAPRRQIGAWAIAGIAATSLLAGCGSSSGTNNTGAVIDGAKVTTLSMQSTSAYTPQAQSGGTDDYHCTLLNPHVQQNSFIVASQFFPGTGPATVEVHHAILFLVPPELVSAAETANNGGAGWTCFGEPPVLGRGLSQFLNMPWLSAWAPGHGRDVMPLTTGTPLAKGSLVIMQVHYNLLVGDLPVRPSAELQTVPASTKLRPSTIQPIVAVPNIPCPAGVTGPLCDRQAEVADLDQRFGVYMGLFDAGMESICGENSVNPPVGDSTSCVWHIGEAGYIVRDMAHMHLTGTSETLTLNPDTPQAQTIMDVPQYNFHYQRAYDLKNWVKVTAGESVKVSCTYDPKIAQELPSLRSLPPHFITWGDGSSDEMCLGLVWEVPMDPNTTVDWSHPAGGLHIGD
ncbi:MAG TPA: hypothetical protein VKR22_06065 [Acidimicrobiales bacterium]|nr:hypothetical protein [Acidimicrobiales bacterium]